jgi:hypothetical protein
LPPGTPSYHGAAPWHARLPRSSWSSGERPTGTWLDSDGHVAHTVRMGETAAVLACRPMVDRGPLAGQSDDDLVARVRAGEAAAFEEIYDRYARGMLAFCMHMLGNREAAEDALQLTFVSAYRAL